MKRFIKKQPPARIIAFGFAALILIGSGLLMLPWSIKEGKTISYTDALYTSTSAVCVTGLIAVDPGDNLTVFGQIVLFALIEIGGLGVTSVGAGLIIAMRKRMDLKGLTLVREGSNLDSAKGIYKFIKSVFLTTVTFQGIGTVLSFIVFSRRFPFMKALWVSIFHSVAAFNNAGFDILGGGRSLMDYSDNIMLNLTTCALIICGSIGFLVIRELLEKKFRWKKLSMHSKIVLAVSVVLIVAGTVLIKITESEISWLGALFFSVSTRTAGFSTFNLGTFKVPTLIVMSVLMFIGASPGSTGGGIKTTTIFTLLQGIKSAATNKSEKAFKYSLPSDAFRKAAVIFIIAVLVVITGTFLLCAMEIGNQDVTLADAFFEAVSAFGTVGLSTGITSGLSTGSKLLSIVIMFIGRLGPLTIASLWYFNKGERVSYPVGNISIG